MTTIETERLLLRAPIAGELGAGSELPPDPVDHVQGEGRRWHFAIAERQTDRRIGTVQVEPRARWQPIVAMVDVSNAPALRLATRVGFTPGRVVIEYGTEQQIFTAPLRAIANSVEPA